MNADELMNSAIAEAYASCSMDDGVPLYTIEFNHPTFDTPARIVRWPVLSNEVQHFTLKLEDTAPSNPGEYVDFLHAPFEVTLPAQEENAPGEFQIRIENIGHIISTYLKDAVSQRTPIQMIFREYLKNIPEEPQLVYTDFSISKVTVSNNNIEATATMIDWLLKVYGRIYTPSEFPGLVRTR